MKNLIKKIQNTVFQEKLFGRGDKIILAVSGGPDSSCLDIFSKLQSKYDLRLAIAHVNYSLRGGDSRKDEEFVRKLAKRHNLKIYISKPKIKSTSENDLREIRYNFFEKTRNKIGFDLIAVAHNADDQVETFLMRVIRGSGLQGLTSIKHKNDKIIRPLLNVPRKEILSYLKKNKLAFRIDKTNEESKFLRNKIRNKLLPLLEKNFNPKIKETIYNSLESIIDDYDCISKITQEKMALLETSSVSAITKFHPAIQKRIILELIKNKKPDIKNIESSHIKEILKALRSTKNKNQIVTLAGLKVTRRNDKLKIEKR